MKRHTSRMKPRTPRMTTTHTSPRSNLARSVKALKPASRWTVAGNTDDDNSDASWRGTWLCRPYRRERLLEEINSANRKGVNGHAAVLDTLKNSGVMIFIVDSKVSVTTGDIMKSVHNIIRHVSKEERMRTAFLPRVTQRCLLYRDNEGRFFNLTLAEHTTASAGQWRGLLNSFSAFQAVMVLTVLCRSFACATQSK
jgi:hypothetical protein